MQNKKIKSISKTVLYTVSVFLCISVVALFQQSNIYLGTFYAHYIGDFSIGFCSRMFLGQILSLFKDSFTVEWVSSFVYVCVFVMFFISAAYIGSVIAKSEKSTQKALLIFIAMICVYPVSFNSFLNINFGFLEIFMIMLFVITAFAGESKIFIYFTPVLIFSGILIHESFMFSFMCPILALVAYYATKTHKKTVFTSAGFILSAVSAVGTAVYSVFFARNTIKMTEEQMLTYLAEKGNTSVSRVSGYLETFLFYTDTVGNTGKDHAGNIFEVFNQLVEMAAGVSNATEIFTTLAALPFLLIMAALWCICIRNAKGFTQKIPYILFMLTPIPQMVAATIISMDYMRFFAALIISQAFYLFVCAKQKDPAVIKFLETLSGKAEILILPCALMLLSGLT